MTSELVLSSSSYYRPDSVCARRAQAKRISVGESPRPGQGEYTKGGLVKTYLTSQDSEQL